MAIAPLGENSPAVTGFSGTERSEVPPLVPDHTLLRCIGRGSYGEVWLARNSLGTYRAVKIVHRHSFEDHRPFDRELHGIEKFEPISRSHEGFMDILQVGRNEADEYFYCVMELADDVGPKSEKVGDGESGRFSQAHSNTFSPATYQPRTLRHAANKQGGLPVAECLHLGLALTDALGFLHERGLVHRDIKPSNIIFVNGVPKLADIGLVTGVDATRSFVGTEGFNPPEGPGTPQADLYSLGKVLYEISTGKDRQEFPDLPTNIGRSPEREELLELNEILVKACAHDAHKRYATAKEMRGDLALLESGRSIRRLRVAERRFALARSVGVVAIGVAVLAMLAVLFFARQAKLDRESRKRIQEALTRAQTAEQAARQESYARAMLLAHEAVQANNFGLVRDLLEQTRPFAMEAGPTNSPATQPPRSIPLPQQRHVRRETRDESAFVLAQCESSVDALAISLDGQWLAAGEQNGQVQLWNLLDCDLQQAWHVFSAEVECVAFSPDNRLLAVGGIDGGMRVLAVPSGDRVWEFREESRILDLRFSSDGRSLIYGSTHGFGSHDFAKAADTLRIGNIRAWRSAISPEFYAVRQPEGLVLYWGQPWTNTIFPNLIGDCFPAHAQVISPDSRWLATAFADHSIELWSFAEKRLVRSLAGHTAPVAALAWSADGRLLGSGGFDQTVAVWDAERGVLLRRLQGHQDHVTTVAFSPDGRTLYSASADRTIRTWTDWNSFSTPENETSAFVDNRPEDDQPSTTVAGEANNARSALPWEWRHLQYECRDEAASVLAQCAGSVGAVTVSSDGAWLAVGVDNGQVLLLDLLDGQLRQEWQVAQSDVDCLAFSPNSRWLAAGCEAGSVHVLAIPSGEPIAEFHEPNGIIDLCFSQDGTRLAYCSDVRLSIYEVLTGNRCHEITASINRVALSQDLKLVTATLLPQGLAWWCGDTNLIFPDVVGNIFTDHGQAISPDGRWLAIALADYSIELWSVAEKRPVRRLTGHTAAVRAVAWSPDSRLLASGGYDQTVTVWDAERGTSLRRLRGHRDFVATLAFSPDGRTLYSGSYDHTVRTWTDLEAAPDPDVIALPTLSAYACLDPRARFAWGVAAGGNAFWAIQTQPSPKPYSSLQDRHAHLAISPDGQWLVAAYKVCVLFRYKGGEYTPFATHQITVTTETQPVFSPDGSRVALVGTNGVLTLWQLEPWRELGRWQGVEGKPSALMFDPPGKRILVRCQYFGVFAAEIDTGRLIRMPKASKSEISGFDISPDNRFLAMVSFNGTVVLWSCSPGEEPRSLGQVINVRTDAWSIVFSPDGQRLALGLADGNIHIWDIEHQMLVGVLKGHRQPVWELGFNPEDDSLVSISPDELRVWRVTNSN